MGLGVFVLKWMCLIILSFVIFKKKFGVFFFKIENLVEFTLKKKFPNIFPNFLV
jgi:hypothetical protein